MVINKTDQKNKKKIMDDQAKLRKGSLISFRFRHCIFKPAEIRSMFHMAFASAQPKVPEDFDLYFLLILTILDGFWWYGLEDVDEFNTPIEMDMGSMPYQIGPNNAQEWDKGFSQFRNNIARIKKHHQRAKIPFLLPPSLWGFLNQLECNYPTIIHSQFKKIHRLVHWDWHEFIQTFAPMFFNMTPRLPNNFFKIIRPVSNEDILFYHSFCQKSLSINITLPTLDTNILALHCG